MLRPAKPRALPENTTKWLSRGVRVVCTHGNRDDSAPTPHAFAPNRPKVALLAIVGRQSTTILPISPTVTVTVTSHLWGRGESSCTLFARVRQHGRSWGIWGQSRSGQKPIALRPEGCCAPAGGRAPLSTSSESWLSPTFDPVAECIAACSGAACSGAACSDRPPTAEFLPKLIRPEADWVINSKQRRYLTRDPRRRALPWSNIGDERRFLPDVRFPDGTLVKYRSSRLLPTCHLAHQNNEQARSSLIGYANRIKM